MNIAADFKLYRVKNRLGELMRRPGGVSREQAVEEATKGIETLREGYVNAIPVEIAALEEMVAANASDEISAHEIGNLLSRAGRLLTLSGTFGYDRLDSVVKRFCDLGLGMIEKGITSVAPIEVHLRAMRLVSPDSAPLADEEAQELLNELSRVHAHFELPTESFKEMVPPLGMTEPPPIKSAAPSLG